MGYMDPIEKHVEYLIIGQGIAGSALALTLEEQNKRFLIIDDQHRSSSSKVAAGLIDPLTGKRLALAWKVKEILPHAWAFYSRMETKFKSSFLIKKPIFRFIFDEKEQKKWVNLQKSSDYGHFFGKSIPKAEAQSICKDAISAFEIIQAGYLNLPKFLKLVQSHFLSTNKLIQEVFESRKLEILPKGVRWKNIRADRLVFCDGYKIQHNPFFSWVPMALAKGDILTLDCPGAPQSQTLNFGKWMVPLESGHFKYGSTYNWSDLTENTSDEAAAQLLSDFSKKLTYSPTLVRHEAGVRPCTKDAKPLVGHHPKYTQIGILNGFASRGVMQSPFFAEQLVAHFEYQTPITPEASINRYAYCYYDA
ncbi:MAG: glycine oxidase [Candidatus Marinamargulisbacteria bacterium]|jgi:glycine oxidase